MKKNRLADLSILLLALCLGASGQGWSQEAEEYKNLPGYFDLSSVPSLGETKSSVEIFFTPGLAKLIGGLEYDDQASQHVLTALKLIKVYTFDARQNDRARLAHKIDELSKKLMSGKWERFIRVQEENSRTEIFTRTIGREIHGMVVLSLDTNEASFVNIVGKLDFEALGKLSKKFDIPQLDSLKAKP